MITEYTNINLNIDKKNQFLDLKTDYYYYYRALKFELCFNQLYLFRNLPW